jgi:hypothetical protein
MGDLPEQPPNGEAAASEYHDRHGEQETKVATNGGPSFFSNSLENRPTGSSDRARLMGPTPGNHRLSLPPGTARTAR